MVLKIKFIVIVVMNKPTARLDLVFGPMFSGKTSELLRRLGRAESIGLKICILNSIKDTRTDNSIKTHDNNKRAAYKGKSLMYVCKYRMPPDISVIGIDEAQFFEDLKEGVEYLLKKNKHVILCGLNGDYKQRKFGQILDLIPIADEIVHLKAYCIECGKEENYYVEAPFTKRIVKNDELELIGGKNNHIAVCRKHLR